MAEQMSDAAAQKMKALCAKVAVAHGLDEQIRRELFGHMEDELLAYLSGRQPLSEDDALILVEKHFGDPAVVRSLFRVVHSANSHVLLIRRLLALISMEMGIVTVSELIERGIAIFNGGDPRAIFRWGWLVNILITSICLWTAGIFWTQQAKRCQMPWFDRLSIGRLAARAAALSLFPYLIFFGLGTTSPSVYGYNEAPVIWLSIATLINAIASAAAWAWWCDWPGYGSRRAALGAVARSAWWLIWMTIPAVKSFFEPYFWHWFFDSWAVPAAAGLFLYVIFARLIHGITLSPSA